MFPMLKKIAFAGLGIALLASPLISSADTLSDLQAQIQALLARISALQSQATQTSPILPTVTTGQPDDYGTGVTVGNYCPKLSITMQRGSRDATTGQQVSELQAFLTDYYNLDDGSVNGGFFGKLTHKYIVQFQSEQGLPAFGIAGSLTRAKIASVCGSGVSVQPDSDTTSSSGTLFTLLEGDNVFSLKNDGSFMGNHIEKTIQGPPGTPPMTVVSDDVNVFALSKEFYKTYPDTYDFLVMYTPLHNQNEGGYNALVNNTTKGTGSGFVSGDYSATYGSAGKLKSFVTIFDFDSQLSSPDFPELAHEISHYWLMYIVDPNLKLFEPTSPSHYNTFLDTNTVENNQTYFDLNRYARYTYLDNHDGTITVQSADTTSSEFNSQFHSLSLYLMGLLPASQVQPLTRWDVAANYNLPTVHATKAIVTIGDVIRSAGVREPAYPNTQKNFKIAFILMPRKGEAPTSAQIAGIKQIAETFPAAWHKMTKGLSTIDPVSSTVTTATTQSCSFNGSSVGHGASITAYQSSSVAAGQSCVPQLRICNNGTLSGSYAYVSCSPVAVQTASCSFSGTPVASGASVIAYESSSVPYGQTCVSQQRTCANGSLSGSYANATCLIAPQPPSVSAVLSASDKSSNITLSNGGLSFSQNGVHSMGRASVGVSSGKWYWEVQANAESLVGWANANANLNSFLGSDTNGWGYYSDGNLYHNGVNVIATWSPWAAAVTLGFAFDGDADTMTVYANNVLQGTVTGLSGAIYPAYGRGNGSGAFNFGQNGFKYPSPNPDFKPLTSGAVSQAPSSNTNLANALSALEFALKALIGKLEQ